MISAAAKLKENCPGAEMATKSDKRRSKFYTEPDALANLCVDSMPIVL